MASNDHEKLLNQLQSEVNEVFKQIGRLFAAVGNSDNGKALPVGHVAKLKKMLPESNERFHAALDELEEDLQMAKLVMLRDLVVCREKAGAQVPSAVNALEPSTTTDKSDAVEASIVVEDALDGDVTANGGIEDLEPGPASETAQDTEKNESAAENDATATEEAPITEDIVFTDAVQDSLPAETDDTTNEQKPDTTTTSIAPAERGLHIDTQAQIPPKDPTTDPTAGDEDNPPDTANFSTTNDLDSLFGGPLSAGPGETTANFDLDGTAPADFDFDDFAANLDPSVTVDNDNISSLLPGLEDYASGAPNDGVEEMNFEDFFPPMGGDSSGNPQRDSTFDGLGDLAEFNMDEFTSGADGGTGENVDFDFDFS